MAADGRPYDPELVVEFAFGATWQTPEASRTWVDVSAWAEVALSSNRGRTNELDLFSAARCTITLNNDDRRFDPLNTAGPYYGQLLPGVPVRVRALLNGVSYPRFSGFADGFHHKPGTHSSTVTVPCADGFKTLAGVQLPRAVYEFAVVEDEPHAYWPLREEDGQVATDQSGHGYDLTLPANVSPASALRRFGGGLTFAGTPARGSLAAKLDSTPYTIEAWVRTTEGGAIITQPFGSSAMGYDLYIDEDGYLLATVGDDFSGAFTFTNEPQIFTIDPVRPPPLNDGEAHYVVFVFDPGTVGDATVRAFIDGVRTGMTLKDKSRVTQGEQRPSVGDGFIGDIADVALHRVAFTADQVAERYALNRQVWYGDLTGQRVERILDLIGWPDDLRDIDTGAVACGNADIAGMSALDYLQVLAQTEQGRLFIAADGKLTFHSLDRTLTGPSVYTFTGDGTGTGIVEGSLTFTLDNTFVFDGAEVQRKYGTTQRVGALRPTKAISLTGLAMRDDRSARVVAKRLVARYRTPRTRADAWTVQPQNDPSSWPAILALEIGDVVTLDATPQRVGDPITLDLFIEQINDKPTPSDWTITFQGSPVDDRDLFRFDGPNTDGTRHGFDAGVFH